MAEQVTPTQTEEYMAKMTPEQQEGLFRLLEEQGCPIERDHAYKVAPVGLAIEHGIYCQDRIFSLRDGRTGLVLDFSLRNELSRRICIVGYQIWPPWGVTRLSLLSASVRSCPRDSCYRFPGDGDYYEGEYVLNYFFARKKSWLNPHEEVEGVILATDELPIPIEYPDDACVTVALIIFDSRSNRYLAELELKVDRSALCTRGRPKRCSASSQPMLNRKCLSRISEYAVSR